MNDKCVLINMITDREIERGKELEGGECGDGEGVRSEEKERTG